MTSDGILHLVYASDAGYLNNVSVAIGSAFLWAVCVETCRLLPYAWGTFGCEAFESGDPKAIHFPGHNPWRLTDNMFPDYIDAYNIWFRYARFVFGRGWTEYCKNGNKVKYATMRVLGWIGSLARKFVDCPLMPSVPFFTRYIRRHYASSKSWRRMLSCMVGRTDWCVEGAK